MTVMCTKCKREYDVSQYMKNGRQLKTCITCRDKAKVYRDARRKDVCIQHIRDVLAECEPETDLDAKDKEEIDTDTDEEETDVYTHDVAEYDNYDCVDCIEDLNKYPKSKLNDNMKLMYMLIKNKFKEHIPKMTFFTSFYEDKGMINIFFERSMTFEDIINVPYYNGTVINIFEQTKWKDVRRIVSTLIEGVSRICDICLDWVEMKASCNVCTYSCCDKCCAEIVFSSGKDKCPNCRNVRKIINNKLHPTAKYFDFNITEDEII